jgi:hypothetical protein
MRASSLSRAPPPAAADQWLAALPAACDFWQALSADARASRQFREIAAANAALLSPKAAAGAPDAL